MITYNPYDTFNWRSISVNSWQSDPEDRQKFIAIDLGLRDLKANGVFVITVYYVKSNECNNGTVMKAMLFGINCITI